MSNVRFDELELMLMAMFEQPTLKDTIQVLTEVQPLVAEEMCIRDRFVGVMKMTRTLCVGAWQNRISAKAGRCPASHLRL